MGGEKVARGVVRGRPEGVARESLPAPVTRTHHRRRLRFFFSFYILLLLLFFFCGRRLASPAFTAPWRRRYITIKEINQINQINQINKINKAL